MEAEDPLSQLKDIHLPDAVAFWPPAPGWWLLLAVVLAALAYLMIRLFGIMQEKRKLDAALSELDTALQAYEAACAFDHQRNQAGLDYLANVNNVLKRVAQSRLPASDSVQLTGRAWLAFLDQHGSNDSFTRGPGQVLGNALYRRNFEGDVLALDTVARAWIQQCYQHKSSWLTGRESEA